MKFQHKVLLAGGLVGALIGLAAAFLYVKNNQERIASVEAGEIESVGRLSPAQGISIGMSVIGLLRQIVSLGQE